MVAVVQEALDLHQPGPGDLQQRPGPQSQRQPGATKGRSEVSPSSSLEILSL